MALLLPSVIVVQPYALEEIITVYVNESNI